MNVHIADADSKIVNLAGAKISAYHKARGDHVTLTRHRVDRTAKPTLIRESFPLSFRVPDVAYVSCVFGWNRPSAERLARGLEVKGVPVFRGGTGFDVGPNGEFPPQGAWSRLPPEIEETRPDYDLYGEDYALGFCRRGCNRRCEFCVVWRKEGTIRGPMDHPSEWVPGGFRKAMLLDNDMALYSERDQRDILGWFTQSGVRHCITQGYDARAIATVPDFAGVLAENKPWDLAFAHRMLYIAWDYIGIEPQVRKALHALLGAGFSKREITVYTLVGHRTTHAEDMYRARVLWEEFGVLPYVMVYNNRMDDPWLRAFARWVNRPRLFKSVAWEDYSRRPAETLVTSRPLSAPQAAHSIASEAPSAAERGGASE